MNFIEILVYRTADGKIPYQNWLESIRDDRMRTRIRVRIDRLRLGNLGDTKSVGHGVHELRMHFGPGFRVYFGYDGQTIVVLLCGGDKSTQSRDIENALLYWNDYKWRK